MSLEIYLKWYQHTTTAIELNNKLKLNIDKILITGYEKVKQEIYTL